MELKPINLGSAPNDGTGDSPRAAGEKINANFDEVRAKFGQQDQLIDQRFAAQDTAVADATASMLSEMDEWREDQDAAIDQKLELYEEELQTLIAQASGVPNSAEQLVAIALTKAASAVDLFVYDTSKDSDGGAWRRRCQNTSWYNEPLNTATRGARRDFPAMALIVAEAAKLTIYDADDPTLPMWMVFNQGADNRYFVGHTANSLGTVTAMNGQVVAGSSAAFAGFRLINFPVDGGEAFRGVAANNGTSGAWKGGLVQRNDPLGFSDTSPRTIVADPVYDISMIVLPDAPIDPASQLPVPTIVVATGSGVSVLNHDGTVANWVPASSGICYRVVAEPNMLVVGGGGGIGHKIWGRYSYPTANTAAVDFTFNESSIPARPGTDGATGSSQQGIARKRSGPLAIATQRGLCLLALNTSGLAGSMVAYLATRYTTGWLVGDIRGAWLATKNTGSIGAELIVNGGFDSDTVWVKGQTGLATTTIAAGKLTLVSPNGDNCNAQQNVLTAGRTYLVTGTATIRSGSIKVAVGNSLETQIAATGDFAFYATPDSSFFALVRNAACDADVDNVSVREVVADRSVKNKHLKVVGTINVAAAAAGAELMAFSGFSAANYLEQPYNADLDFGAGDFCVMGWVNALGTEAVAGNVGRTMFVRQAATGAGMGAGAHFRVQYYSAGVIFQYNDGAGTGAFFIAGPNLVDYAWHHLVCLRRAGVMEIFVDGRLIGTSTGGATANLSNAAAVSRVGVLGYDSGILEPTGKVALVRIGATAPTAAQIRRIYVEELQLFVPDAACTIYGTSDVVVAVAEDKDTELVHVGTSAGRSILQGLRRIGNTTDAVGVAISAANSLVADD